MEMLLNTMRMVDHDQLREFIIGDEDTLKEKLAIAIIHPEDFEKLNLTPSFNLKLISRFGSVIVRIKQDKNVPKGTIVMPVSIWSNQITGLENNELLYKNIKVNIEATRDLVLSFRELLKTIRKD